MKKLVILLSAFLLWFTPAGASMVYDSVCNAQVVQLVENKNGIAVTYKVDLKNKSAYRIYLASPYDVPIKNLASGDHSLGSGIG